MILFGEIESGGIIQANLSNEPMKILDKSRKKATTNEFQIQQPILFIQ